jgi:signal transduction histidine kinase
MVGYGATCASISPTPDRRAGRSCSAARSFSVLFFVLVTAMIHTYGVRGLGSFVYPLVVLFAGLTWSAFAAIGVAVASALSVIAMAFMESRGLLTPVEPEVSAGSASAVITASVARTAVMLVVAPRNPHFLRKLANERRLRVLESDLARAQRMESLGKLAGGLAHDFNNMLTGIIGHAELVTLKAESDPGLKRHAQLILGASERAAQLTQQLLAFSRKRERFVETVGLHQLVKNVLAILEMSVDPRIQTPSSKRSPMGRRRRRPSRERHPQSADNGRDAMPEEAFCGSKRRERTEGCA